MRNPLANARFERGAVSPRGMPPDEGAEVAFAGRSNAGKSSAINALVGRRGVARTSKTPGRTREINFFVLNGGVRLVDLPGYGFARVPVAMKDEWAALVEAYLRGRSSLRGVVQLMDVRRPFTDLDRRLLTWCVAAGLPVHGVLTKADKLSRGAATSALAAAQREALAYPALSVQLFSSTDGRGLEDLRALVAAWLGLDPVRP